ncbi:histidine--tRNA ligase [Actinomadura madurae]|uniref:histidine--tRNA ligase n=2 Tax=Actinomadura madurae TaxID=1993 RepID=UPI0020D1F924|nr:histidine--tRNA ligase [Actinomadura madurae]MCP9969087.1 histidine--tRNA ligase [Actinomadura madurae]MCP9981560.1 histidine--tRNA ligase [Actinomadura madurae]MCQ0006933.1 histidine--tRNA ligase [Actinomadura madurae]MCQ0017758.1 histidine--tRNA ligase [Actinomadura madurae]
MASQQFEPPSGTRDFLAGALRTREHVFAQIREVFERYGFEPLQTPAFERLETLTGKYGDEGDKLIFKILRRGEHEATGEADLALRYDMTVPLARVVAGYGSQLPTPYKRYAMGPVWRADRPGKGRFREFAQCDVDVVGSASPLADAEVVCALTDALDAVGVRDYRVLVNSRQALSGLLEVYGVPADLGGGVLITLDKLDKLSPEKVAAELVDARSLAPGIAEALVGDLTAVDAVERMQTALKDSEAGRAGLEEIGRLLELASPKVGEDRIAFTPSLVRGLDYYTGVIFEVVAEGMPGSIASGGRYDRLIAALGGPDVPACGGSLGVERIIGLLSDDQGDAHRIDVAVTVIAEDTASEVMGFAAQLRDSGLRTEVYLAASRKLAKQLKWAADRKARFALIYGASDKDAGVITVRDMDTGEQAQVPTGELAAHLTGRCAPSR